MSGGDSQTDTGLCGLFLALQQWLSTVRTLLCELQDKLYILLIYDVLSESKVSFDMIEDGEKEKLKTRNDDANIFGNINMFYSREHSGATGTLIEQGFQQLWPPKSEKASFLSFQILVKMTEMNAEPVLAFCSTNSIDLMAIIAFYLNTIESFQLLGMAIDVIRAFAENNIELILPDLLNGISPDRIIKVIMEGDPSSFGLSHEQVLERHATMFQPMVGRILEDLPSRSSVRLVRIFLKYPQLRQLLLEMDLVHNLSYLLMILRGKQVQQKEVLKVMKDLADEFSAIADLSFWERFFNEMSYVLTAHHLDRAAQIQFFKFLMAVPKPEISVLFFNSECFHNIMHTLNTPAYRHAHHIMLQYFKQMATVSPDFAGALLNVDIGFAAVVERIMSSEPDNAIPVIELCIAIASINDDFLSKVFSPQLLEELACYMTDGNWQTKRACLMIYFFAIVHTGKSQVLELLTKYADIFCQLLGNLLDADDESVALQTVQVLAKSLAMTQRDTQYQLYKAIAAFAVSEEALDKLNDLVKSDNVTVREAASQLTEMIDNL